jgi:hypothetical protein
MHPASAQLSGIGRLELAALDDPGTRLLTSTAPMGHDNPRRV